MFKNYFKTAIRNLLRNRVFTIINVLGLVIGITGAIVIYKVVDFEKSFDQYHSDADRVYRSFIHYTLGDINSDNPSVMHPFGPALEVDFPDWEVSRIHWYYNGLFRITNPQGEVKMIKEDRSMAFVEQEFFEMFDFDFVAGNGAEALSNPNSIAMSTTSADKLFGLNGSGYQDIIGRTIDFENQLQLQVTAIYADPPKNTDYGLNYLMSYEGAKIYPYANGLTSWGTRNGATRTLVKLPKGVTHETAAQQLLAKSEDYIKRAGYQVPEGAEIYFGLQPLYDVHLNPDNGYGRLDASLLSTISIIAAALVIIAAINFINLATAQSVKRAKEIGIRKVLGGTKGHLVIQFLGEVFLITVLAVLLSLGLSEALLMKLEPFLGYSLGLNLLSNPETIVFLAGLILATTFLSGFYPAIILSKYNPIKAIKSNSINNAKTSNFSLRRVLVVFQFFISQALIIGTIVVITQMNYMSNKDVGFRTEQLVTFMIPEQDEEKRELLSSRLQSVAGVDKLSFFIATPGAANTNNTDAIVDPRNAENDKIVANRKNVDEYYADLFDIEVVAGEFYTKDSPREQVVINRKLAELLGFSNPQEALGQRFETNWGTDFMIKGVVENFHNRSLRNEIEPVYMLKGASQYFQAGITVNAQNAGEVVDEVSKIWAEIFPNDLFEADYMEDLIAYQYEPEQNMSTLFKFVAGMAIFICCLGLYGLVSFMANQKVKEIGIRKVLGASVQSIMMIFSKEVFVLVAIAFFIAAPLAYFGMNQWLDSYTFRISLGAQVFLIGVSLTFLIAAFTVGSRAFSAASANPVKSLRND